MKAYVPSRVAYEFHCQLFKLSQPGTKINEDQNWAITQPRSLGDIADSCVLQNAVETNSCLSQLVKNQPEEQHLRFGQLPVSMAVRLLTFRNGT